MPGRISHNIIFLSYNLDVNLFLDHLLEQDILDIAEYTAVTETEDDKFQSARRLARHLLKKTSAQIDKFLEILAEHQPGVARHVATMRKRREGAGSVSSTGSTTANNGASSAQSKAARVAENQEGQSTAVSSATASSGMYCTAHVLVLSVLFISRRWVLDYGEWSTVLLVYRTELINLKVHDMCSYIE